MARRLQIVVFGGLGIVVLLAVVHLLRTMEPATPELHPTAGTGKAVAPDDRPESTSRSAAPTSTEAESDHSAAASGLAVELRRGPQEYAESDTLYKFRLTFVEYYDRFREASGLSEEKHQKLLEILADAQLNFQEYEREFERAVMAGPKEATLESWREWKQSQEDFMKYAVRDLASPIREETREQMKALLSSDEYRAWWDYMEPIAPLYLLHLGQPLEIRSAAQGLLAR
jgi:hypothetical protein